MPLVRPPRERYRRVAGGSRIELDLGVDPVGWLGLEGDAQRENTVHGGPHRAVSLFAVEAIRRVASGMRRSR